MSRQAPKIPAKATPTRPLVRIESPSADAAGDRETEAGIFRTERVEPVGAAVVRQGTRPARHMNGTRPTSWTATWLTPNGSSIVPYTMPLVQTGGLAEERAREQGDRQHAGKPEEQRRQAHGGFVVAEQAQRHRLRPEEQDRLVEERLAEERRRHVVAAPHHLLRDRGVQPFVGIDSGADATSGASTSTSATAAKTRRR